MTSTPTPSATSEPMSGATIEADGTVPLIRITRDFATTPERLMRAHTDPDLFARWVGPESRRTEIVEWDARTGGSWRYLHVDGDDVQGFHGCFHEVGDRRLVQTFTWEGMPSSVSLQTFEVTDLGDGRTRLVGTSLVDSFETRDDWLHSGMEVGVTEGYAALDALLAELD